MARLEKFCPRCQSTKSVDEFAPNRARHDGFSGYCRRCQIAANAEWEQRLRVTALELLGNRCNGCQITDLRVLCFDHIAGGGAAARRRGRDSGPPLYRRIIGGEPGFQILCWNCNHIKRIEEGEHVGNRVYERGVRLGWSEPVTETVTM